MSEVFLVQMVGTYLGKCEWVWEEKLRWLIDDGQIQDGRFQEGCHHIENQNELVWVRVSWNESVFEWIWEKITRCLNLTWQCLNPKWQNSRWPPLLCKVRMNEFESHWISLSQIVNLGGKCEWSFFCANGGKYYWQMWVGLRGKTKIPKSKMGEFKMVTIIKLIKLN